MTGPGDVQVMPARLAEAATAARAVADTVRGADVAGPVRAVGAALPGAATAGAAQALADRWAASVTGLAELVARHAAALGASADAYAGSDRSAADALRPSDPAEPTSDPGPAPGPGAITRALG